MKIIFLSILFLSTQAMAQTSFRSSPFTSGFGMRGIHTYAGFGFADFTVDSPAASFRMDKGVYAFLGGEREINESGTSVTISFNYMTSDGQANYNYSTLGGSTYTGSDIAFSSNNYQLGLGIKQRFFPSSWLRPYIEAGGLFGYHELKYTTTALKPITGPDTNFKSKDSLTGFGYYGEAGIEVDFSETYGVRVGGKYLRTETRKFETLGNNTLKYDTYVFLLAFLLRM